MTPPISKPIAPHPISTRGHGQQAPWDLRQQRSPPAAAPDEGQCSDFAGADVLLKDLPPAAMVIGDQGYDSDKIRKMLAQQGITPCIPPRRCRKKPVHYSKRLYRKRHKIENLFSRLKDWRRIATRYDRWLHPGLPFCHPPGRHCPLLVMSPDPRSGCAVAAVPPTPPRDPSCPWRPARQGYGSVEKG